MISPKKFRKTKPNKPTPEFNFNIQTVKSPDLKIVILVTVIIAIALSVYFIFHANAVNGFLSFPLDDPWIHLTFAKNIADYGSFSYFKNEVATAGSTSPLFTILLAIGFFISHNEMILGYFFGVLFFLLAAVSFYRLSEKEFGNSSLLVFLCIGFFLLDKWLTFIAASGMETTMFIFFLILGMFFYKSRNPVPTGLILGLILWTRPDGVAFIGALIIDYAYKLYLNKTNKQVELFTKRELMKVFAAFAVVAVLYFSLNLYLSGSLLPNTYNAKLAYYSPEFRSRVDFLSLEVWDYFTTGSYSILMAGTLISILFITIDVFSKKYNRFFVYLIFILAFIFIYWYKLPYAHRFGRYMMPIIPFFIFLSIYGFSQAAVFLYGKFKFRLIKQVTLLVLFTSLIISTSECISNADLFASECRYIHNRQVVTAEWLKEHTNETDVICTHDIGAIGFYSERKIIDAAGLITPALVKKLNTPEYAGFLKNYMKENDVKYLAFLREWFRVVNQRPLFSTINESPVEVMEVFEFYPDSTHILMDKTRSLITYAEQMISQNKPQIALNALSHAVLEEPDVSLTYYLMAYCYASLGNNAEIESNLLKAINIYPEYTDALYQLGNFYIETGDKISALKYLTLAFITDPGNENIIALKQRAESMANNKINPK